MSKIILVTGAAGYIGCHCVLSLLQSNYEVVALDNCSNAVLINGQKLPESLRRVEVLADKRLKEFVFTDLTKESTIDNVFKRHQILGVIHLSSVKSITESISKAFQYYNNNIKAILNLLDSMERFEVYNLLFGSSASVYGKPKYLPIDESHPIGQSLTSPYAKSVFMIEQILQDLCASNPKWTVVSLRIFNTTGAHFSGDIGEDPPTVPKNLMPYITQVAIGRRPELRVYGSDYDTRDGTGIRDYIHIEDVCDLIVIVLNKMLSENWLHWYAFNVGSGSGHSVLEVCYSLKHQSFESIVFKLKVISMFESIFGNTIPHEVIERRIGDIGQSVANISLSEEILKWKPKRGLKDICESALKWQKRNQKGFDQ